MGSNNNQLTTLPAEVKGSLPIFQLLGDQLPDKLQTPEAKKTMSKFFFWAILLGLGVLLYKMAPTLIQFGNYALWIGGYALIFVLAYWFMPTILNQIHNLGRILLFKSDKAMAQHFNVETLELSLQDMKKVQQEAHQKISDVDALRRNMLSEGDSAADESDKKYQDVKTLMEQADDLDGPGGKKEKALGKNDEEKANDFQRQANELRSNANLRKIEGDNALELSKTYAQYANNFGRFLEILKDNESSAKILYSMLDSSINIIKKKLDMTNRMAKATKGLADAFGIKDGWKFQVALEAAGMQISSNIAQIRSNMELVNEGRMNTIGATKSPNQLKADLSLFVNQLNSGNYKKLDVKAIGAPYHELTKEEAPDQQLGLLD